MADDRSEFLHWATLSVSDNPGHYRWTVSGNADIPGCVDICYEEWDEKKREWVRKAAHTHECMPIAILKKLVEAAEIVSEYESRGAQ